MPQVAALFVETGGVYYGLPNVDPWDEQRDARLYAGPYPVVAHPPCARWSRLAGFTEARFGYKRGGDGGCFEAALRAVREFGGVLEHPAYSSAWDHFGLAKPIWRGGWTLGLDGGASCYVEQGRYGLPVKKATWLYAYGVELPELRWGYTSDVAGDSANQNEWGGMDAWRRSVSYDEASDTPPEFRDVLLTIAASARPLVEGVGHGAQRWAATDGLAAGETPAPSTSGPLTEGEYGSSETHVSRAGDSRLAAPSVSGTRRPA